MTNSIERNESDATTQTTTPVQRLAWVDTDIEGLIVLAATDPAAYFKERAILISNALEVRSNNGHDLRGFQDNIDYQRVVAAGPEGSLKLLSDALEDHLVALEMGIQTLLGVFD